MFFACFGWDWVGKALQKAITWQNHANAILRTLFLLALVGLGGGALQKAITWQNHANAILRTLFLLALVGLGGGAL